MRIADAADVIVEVALGILDGIEELLIELAARDLERGAITDSIGALRLVYPTPTWTELLDLAVTEVRVYGADSPQVAGRLRALLFDLADIVPDVCRDAVDAQLTRLDVAVGTAYADPVERAHAQQADRLGIGGAAPVGLSSPAPIGRPEPVRLDGRRAP